MRFNLFTRAFAACAIAALAGAAQGAIIAPGTYLLHNHPDGSAEPPPYGARFDELVDATSGHDIFTLDFDAIGSYVTLTYTGSTIVIEGNAYGGRDVGGSYAGDVYQGIYEFYFSYSLGVQGVPGDDDIWVDTVNHVNTGYIITPNGEYQNLVDERGSFDYSFRLGDENDDNGHRGFDGISGWGWMSYDNDGGISHVEATDWLFTVGDLVPAPGASALAVMGVALVARRRR